MISCDRTSCPWWDEDGCLSEECGDWNEGTYMNKPTEMVGERNEDERDANNTRPAAHAGRSADGEDQNDKAQD